MFNNLLDWGGGKNALHSVSKRAQERLTALHSAPHRDPNLRPRRFDTLPS